MNGITFERLQGNESPVIANVLSHAFLTQPNNIAILHRQDEYARNQFDWVITFAKGATYLETNRPINLPSYQRAGFVVVGEEKIMDLTNRFLWRAPRK